MVARNVIATRRGDFWEVTSFATEVAKVLGVTLVRNQHGESMVGIPNHCIAAWTRLLELGGFIVTHAQPIEDMRTELVEAGWQAKTRTIWKDPNGKLWIGPYGAWREMRKRTVGV